MNVVVAEASVLLDLERGGLVEKCFSLPYQFVVPDLLYQNELARHAAGPCLGESLIALGLRVEDLDGDQLGTAIHYRRKRPSISLPQALALVLSLSRRWTLLTNDSGLRSLADKLALPCHGVLWVLDQVYRAGMSSPEDIVGALQAISDHSRCRLLQGEIADRIVLYSSTSKGC